MLYIIGVFISVFLSMLLLTKKGRNQADLLLGIWMFVIAIHLSAYYSFVSNAINSYPNIIWINFSLPFLHGPMLFLYALALSTGIRLSLRIISIHFLLPIMVLVTFSPFLLYSFDEKLEIIRTEGRDFETQINFFSYLLDISGFFYIFITFRVLNRHKKRILDEFSYQEKINLDWLRMLFYGMTIMWVLIIIIQSDELIFSSTSLFVIIIGFYGIKQVGIFTNEQKVEATEEIFTSLLSNADIEKKKYAKSGLNEASAKELHQRLTSLMASERLFKEPELTLTELANKLEIHPNYLSQVINEIEGVNFYDYINTLRVEEFKRLASLPENSKFTFLALAFDCGFNSKSAFNRFFKKSTGLSPSEFLKNQT